MTSFFSRYRTSVILSMILLAGFAAPAFATQKVWNGSVDANWSTAGNWSPAGTPVAGDGVSFTLNPANKTSNANLGNVALTNIDFSGGDGFIINGAVTINAQPVPINILNGNGNNTINATISVLNADLYVKAVTPAKQLTLGGAISGSFGVRIYGPGPVEFKQSANNTYTGTTTVASTDSNGANGLLQLNSNTQNAIPGALQIGGQTGTLAGSSPVCRLIISQCIAATSVVTINTGGLFDLSGKSETFTGLTMVGGSVTHGAGTLTVTNVTMTGGSVDVGTGGLNTSTLSINAGSITGSTGKLSIGAAGSITVPASSTAGASITTPVQINTSCTITVNPGTSQPELTINTSITESIAGSTITKSGTGQLDWLSFSGNTYTGLTTVDKGLVRLNSSNKAIIPGNLVIGNNNDPASTAIVQELQSSDINNGTNSSSITINFSGKLDLNNFSEIIGGFSGTGELALGSAAGSQSLTFGTGNPAASFGGKITGTGALIKLGSGTQILAGSSNFGGSTTIRDGTLELNDNGINKSLTSATIQIGDGTGVANSAVLKLDQSLEIIDTAAITILSDGQLNMTGGANGASDAIGSIAGSGSIVLAVNRTLTVAGDTSTTYNGVISGLGSLAKSGTGTLTLTANNSLTGSTSVAAGTLIINGTQPLSNVFATGSGTLGGTGIVGQLNIQNTSLLSPGTSGTGTLSGIGALTFASTSSFNVDLNSTAAGGFDSLNITGTVSLGSSTLNLTAPANFTAPVGTKIILITNDAADAITGTFANLFEGALISAGTVKMSISYVGSTGNDVELTVANFAPVVSVPASALPSSAGVGQSVAFSVAGTDANNDPITYSWTFGDGTNDIGANTTHSYAAPGTYNVSVSLSDGNGGSATSTTTVIVAAPAVSSAASALPSPAGVGQTVSYAVGVTDPNSAATLSYAWDFGDNSTGSGASTTHAYAAAGTYTVTVNIDNGLGGKASSSTSVTVVAPLIGIGLDSDGDGFSDDYETAAGSSPSNAADSPTGQPATPPQSLTATKLNIKLNFAKANSDSISFGGTLSIPAGFTPADKKVFVDVGGVSQSFILDAKGSSISGKNSFKVSIKSKSGVVLAQTPKYSLKLTGSFAKSLADEGLVGTADDKGSSHAVQLTVMINNITYQALKTVTFKAKKDKSASATSK